MDSDEVILLILPLPLDQSRLYSLYSTDISANLQCNRRWPTPHFFKNMTARFSMDRNLVTWTQHDSSAHDDGLNYSFTFLRVRSTYEKLILRPGGVSSKQTGSVLREKMLKCILQYSKLWVQGVTMVEWELLLNSRQPQDGSTFDLQIVAVH